MSRKTSAGAGGEPLTHIGGGAEGADTAVVRQTDPVAVLVGSSMYRVVTSTVMPVARRRRGPFRRGPAGGWVVQRIAAVFPVPLGQPSSPKHSPSTTASSSPSTAFVSPNLLVEMNGKGAQGRERRTLRLVEPGHLPSYEVAARRVRHSRSRGAAISRRSRRPIYTGLF